MAPAKKKTAGQRRSQGTGSLREVEPGVWKSVVDRTPDPATGKRRQRKTTIRGGRREAERRHAELVRDADEERARNLDPSDLSAADIVQAYLDSGVADGRWSPRTLRDYKRILRDELTPKWGDTPALEITRRGLKAWHRELATGKRPAPNAGNKLGVRSVKQYHALLAAAYNWALTDGELIDVNPVATVKAPAPPKAVIELPKTEAVRECLAEAELDTPEMFTAIRLSVATGVRRATLCGFQWRDVKWERSEIAAERRVVLDEDDKSVCVPLSKTGRHHNIALDERTMDVLRDHHTRMVERCTAVDGDLAPDAFMFSSDALCAKPWRPDSVSAGWARIRERAGHTAIRLHDLRHYNLSMLLAEGMDPAAVAERGAHSSPVTTLNMYAHAVPAKNREAADTIGGLLDD